MNATKRTSLLLYVCVGLLLLPAVVPAQTQTTCPGTQPSRLVEGQSARVVSPSGINLRTLPDTNSQRLDIVPTGTIVPVLEGPFCAGRLAWYRIEYRNQRGWTAEGLNDGYFLAPYIIQRAQLDTVALSGLPELVTSINASKQQSRVEFMLMGYPVIDGFFPPVVRVFDSVPDFDEVQAVRNALDTQNADWLEADAISNTAFLPLEDGVSLRYTSLFINVGTPDVPPVLLYSARGITRDGRYISFNLPVTTANLPRPFRPTGDPTTYLEDYMATHQEILNLLPDDRFTPDLSLLDALLQSITTTATPIPTEDLIPYVYFDSLRFDYPPSLARSVEAHPVQGTPDLARHIRVDFAGYPVQNTVLEPLIRVYSADFIEANRIIRLNLLLEQQPTSPPQIVIPFRANYPQALTAQIDYQDFRNGRGVRFLAGYERFPNRLEPQDVFYSFQGVTDDGRFYISAVFPLQFGSWPEETSIESVRTFLNNTPAEAITPSLYTLDALMQSLQMRVQGA